MSEQPQQGAGYPQPTSGQPAQAPGGYQQQPYASPQAQYQQQAYGYAPAGPSFFDKIGVPSLPAILALSGLGGYLVATLIAGFGEDAMRSFTIGTVGGVQTTSTALLVMVGLTFFLGPQLRKLWQSLALVAGVLVFSNFLVTAVSDHGSQMNFETGEVTSSGDKGDAAAWIGAIILIAAVGCLVAAALLRGGPESEEDKAAKAQQQAAAAAAQQQMQQQYQTGQVAQPQQQPSQPQQPGQPGQQWPQQ
ncbi:hypothetical protein [Natronoglycomyces albus]|uniref:Uncharacterized protein n=1 Tax=Natronoglycomyces albus TaxID=2811108 RepID=A0A895XNR7_9ACTN|nr:hypothetical protein [Natronoglycomyces albus]QSB05412.1 hypothetical protein JQS30_00240 [Natronoglycomyces albus]